MRTVKVLKRRDIMDLLDKEELKTNEWWNRGMVSTLNVTTTRKFPWHSKWMEYKYRTNHCK
jgi:hypothetical protein